MTRQEYEARKQQRQWDIQFAPYHRVAEEIKKTTQKITYTTYTQTGRQERHSGIVQSIELRGEMKIVTYVDKDGLTHKVNILSPHVYDVVIK